MMAKPIVLIGGTAGTGKSTLARELAWEMRFDHRLGTGFLREVAKSYHSVETAPDLYSFTFRAENPIDHLIAQARVLKPAIDACITRARNEGTSLVIEGNHLIPALYHDAQVDLFIVLCAPEAAEHHVRLHGQSHAKRRLSESDIINVRGIDEYLRAEASRYGVPSILYADNFGEFVDLLNTRMERLR
ncbi:MAG TPA: AAA family ATPase [Candidatus Binataceae bacterium]|nr:AAA family ATPase [Candidatus Binataceae bacterium]